LGGNDARGKERMDLTVEQRKAIAMAAARLRLKQKQAIPDAKNQSRLGADQSSPLIKGDMQPDFMGAADEAMTGRQPTNIGIKGDMRAGDRIKPDLTDEASKGLTFDIGDEIIAGGMTPVEMLFNKATGKGPTAPGEAYQQLRAKQNAREAATWEQHPYLAPAAKLAGGLATAPAVAGKAVQSGNLLSKTVRGGATGGTMGAASGFGSGGESLEDRLGGAETGAVGGAFIGSALPPVASTIGKTVQGVSNLGTKASELGDFGGEELAKKSKAAYEAADRGVGTLKMTRDHVLKLRRSFNDVAKDRGIGGAFSEVIAPDYAKSSQRLAAFNKIANDVNKGLRPPPTFGELERLRQGLRGAVTEAVTPQGHLTKDGELASRFIDSIDEMIDTTPFKDARNAYKLMRKTEIIEDAFNAAKNATGSNYTQAGFETAIRQQFRRIAGHKNFERQFSKSEQEAILAVVRPGKLETALKRLGFLAPKGAISSMFTAGMTYANPFIGVPLAAAGLAGKHGSTAMAINSAQKAGKMVANGGTLPQLPPPTTKTRDFLTAAPFGLIPYGYGQNGQ
jgi:hypothetical protein